MKKLTILLIVLSVFVAACASTPATKPRPTKLSAEYLEDIRLRGDPIPKILYPSAWPVAPSKKSYDGWVLVVFDILQDGSTSNIRVAETHNLNKKFETASIRATEKSIYEPQKEIISGSKRKFIFKFEAAD